jgi:hypothetical protein
MEYIIVYEKLGGFGGVPFDQLTKAVALQIAKGWQPLGAPALAGNMLFQAMTKG